MCKNYYNLTKKKYGKNIELNFQSEKCVANITFKINLYKLSNFVIISVLQLFAFYSKIFSKIIIFSNSIPKRNRRCKVAMCKNFHNISNKAYIMCIINYN